jgi:mono/diheme cytochrome c family protein
MLPRLILRKLVSRKLMSPKLGTIFCRVVPALAILAVATTSPFWALSEKPVAAKVTEDLPPGAMQAKATTACLECHEARIILQQRLSKAAWTKEVDKMIKWGAVVDPNDRDALIDYLSTNFSVDQPAYVPPRTTAERSSPGKTAK